MYIIIDKIQSVVCGSDFRRLDGWYALGRIVGYIIQFAAGFAIGFAIKCVIAGIIG